MPPAAKKAVPAAKKADEPEIKPDVAPGDVSGATLNIPDEPAGQDVVAPDETLGSGEDENFEEVDLAVAYAPADICGQACFPGGWGALDPAFVSVSCEHGSWPRPKIEE